MEEKKMLDYISVVLKNMPADWLGLTTHRLDIYNEELAKTQFLDQFESLFEAGNSDGGALAALPTAYDYIRLGHPLSSILEWTVARLNGLPAENVIAFSSQMMPVLAVLRKNLFSNTNTLIVHQDELPQHFDKEKLRHVYGYGFEVMKVEELSALPDFDGSLVLISKKGAPGDFKLSPKVDFLVRLHDGLGSLIAVYGAKNEPYISEIQHVRRRESIAMTPGDSLKALRSLAAKYTEVHPPEAGTEHKRSVLDCIATITDSNTPALLGNSGLSVQYAIMMGLIDDAIEEHSGKGIRFLVPPNCYGGTNDQARRVAACLENVEVLDLPVDGENDMVSSIDRVLTQVAKDDGVPYIIAEIPTNPRVEVPNLHELRVALSKRRKTSGGADAVTPVFILDQTFCPNVRFCGGEGILSSIKTISYVSGSKFPSGGRCTAGYCIANKEAASLLPNIGKHLRICDNEAADHQIAVLAEQLPSMIERIRAAYENTRDFVNYIHEVLPEAKINFVSEELAAARFTPSVFSLDLPTKGETRAEKEAHKRKLNLRLIDMMITEIPEESKYCVSYGQLKGCYWTIPATSTQGTTKEADKDYIARVAISPKMDMEKHKRVFSDFVRENF